MNLGRQFTKIDYLRQLELMKKEVEQFEEQNIVYIICLCLFIK